MPVSVTAEASAMASPRVRTSDSASASDSTPAYAAAVISPTLWPATAPKTAGEPSAEADSRPAATSRGWATAVSRISSASAFVP